MVGFINLGAIFHKARDIDHRHAAALEKRGDQADSVALFFAEADIRQQKIGLLSGLPGFAQRLRRGKHPHGKGAASGVGLHFFQKRGGMVRLVFQNPNVHFLLLCARLFLLFRN